MAYLNGAEACWLLTKNEYDAGGNRIAYKLNYLPYFTRELSLYGQEGYFVHTWNFGHPQATFVPNTYTTEGDTIYDKCWKSYIGDLYNENTRKLTCYVRAELDGKPWPWWLRRFYWFQNAIWRLNEIKDLNMASFDVTQMEFIKVQDMENYKLEKIEYQGNNELVLDDDLIGCEGGTITGTMYLQGAGGWYSADAIYGEDEQGNQYALDAYVYMSPRTGRGNAATNFTITVPPSSAASPITWDLGVEDDFDNWYRVSFVQQNCSNKRFTFVPSSASLSSQSGTTSTTLENIGYNFNSWCGLTGTWFTATTSGNDVTIAYDTNAGSARQGTISAEGTDPDTQEPIYAYFTLSQSAYVPPAPTNTWSAYNASDWNVYGNLLSGGDTYAGLEVHSGETEIHNETVPATFDEAWLALTPGPSTQSAYQIVLSNSRTGEYMTCSWTAQDNAWVGSGLITIEQDDVLDIDVQQTRGAVEEPESEPEGSEEEAAE